MPDVQSAGNTNTNIASDPLEYYAKDNFILKIHSEICLEDKALADNAINSSVSTYYQVHDRRRLHTVSTAAQCKLHT